MADLVVLTIGGSLDKVPVYAMKGSVIGLQCHWSFLGDI